MKVKVNISKVLLGIAIIVHLATMLAISIMMYTYLNQDVTTSGEDDINDQICNIELPCNGFRIEV